MNYLRILCNRSSVPVFMHGPTTHVDCGEWASNVSGAENIPGIAIGAAFSLFHDRD
jgi:hypothetical protein